MIATIATALLSLVAFVLIDQAQVMGFRQAERSRIADHLVCVGAMGLDTGAFTYFHYAFNPRELIYDIFEALPFAGFGALATLMLFGIDLNVYAFVGVILLVGLVKKNGIMMVDFAIEAQKDATKSAAQAIHEASVVRFRPIMMTTMAALFGTLPIALGIGAGAESRQPLGLAVVGGLLFSQLLTLYVTPVVFVYMDQFQGFLRRHLRRKEPLAAHAAE